MRRLCLLLALIVGAGSAAAPAGAGTVSVERSHVDTGSHSGGYDVSVVRYDAASGEVNEVGLALDGGQLTLTDPAGAAAGRGCRSTAADAAVCAHLDGTSGWGSAQVGLSDGDDVMHDSVLSATVDAGPGNDVVALSDGMTIGGPGDDDLTAPMVRYDDRVQPVDVDLAAGTATLAGEIDRLSGLRYLVLSQAADRFTGSNADEQVFGLGGDDVMLGGGGRDMLDGGDGADWVDGGDGDDLVQGGTDERDRNVVLGGSGNDTVSGAAGADLLIGGPGVDLLDGYGGADRFAIRDGSADSVFCTRAARIVADWMDAVQGCRRIERDAPPVLLLTSGGTQYNPEDGPRGHASLVCSPDVPTRRCHGNIAVFVADRPADRTVTRVRGTGYIERRLALPARADAIRRRCGAVALVYVMRARDTSGRVRVMVRTGIEPGARDEPAPGCQT